MDEPRAIRVDHSPEQAHGAVVRALALVASGPLSRDTAVKESERFAGETLSELPGVVDDAALQALAERVSRVILGLSTVAVLSLETATEALGIDRLELLKRIQDVSAVMYGVDVDGS
jgi:hypothetical protein